ncbi:DUF4847 family protein [Bacteroides gallinaceum]|uniref:DUF4847 family protein n=2 Tax=Bacteroidaceae TaxID=815 RepID=A0ABT7X1F2_9BACE|nr:MULTISPECIES: DUF4847 family protein [Bacteroidaceae]CCZ69327.1 putative uncharacterized protein [Bacteroides sp. CAG:702]HJD10703.1 DUF4847 family protein [Candidatus Phocaeicola caecigallinarum]MBD8040121.1 DUF4847 family protein [Phocaeicola intestinalis]MBM6657224.1 DUF4847 family protein [Bacteroides gallinaceum]MBM6718041.1 DUF4847 family protein [Bacteroides gallinaceum]
MRKYGLYIWLCMATLLCGCNQEDDVFEIFASGQTWHWSGSYDTTNWQDDNNYTLTTSKDDLEQINKDPDKFIIQFAEDGSVTGQGESFTFTGTWSADGNDRSFSVRLTPNHTPSGRDKTFYDEISNAHFYRGDSQLIKLFNADKNHYIQFYPVGFRN